MTASSGLIESKKRNICPSNSVIKGKFPGQASVYKKPAVLKLNSMLAVALIPAVIISMISYLGVIAKESKVKDLHLVTNKINYENIELQNKVDYLKSFYTIDDKVQKIDFLKKADRVLEVEKKNKIPVSASTRLTYDITAVPGY